MNSTRTRGKKSTPHPDPENPPRCRANKRKGHGTYANDRPPIFSVVNRDTGEIRFAVRERTTQATCEALLNRHIPVSASIIYTDEWSGYQRIVQQHLTVCHSTREWARDADGDGVREVHCNTCEGAGAGLRTFLRLFRGVHKRYLADYVAVYETILNAKRITSTVVQRLCFGDRLHGSYT